MLILIVPPYQNEVKMKKFLLFITMSIIYSLPCFGVLSIDDVDPISHVVRYNSLPSVEDADRELSSHSSFQEVVSRARQIVCSSGLEDFVGFRLIHRHFRLDHEQVMVENFGLDDEIPSLITSALNISVAREKEVVPSGWIFSGSQVDAFEFSTDPAVKSGATRIQENPHVFSALKDLIMEYKLETLLAVGIIKRDSLPRESGTSYIEESKSGMSVVQVRDARQTGELIRTVWTLVGSGDVDRGGCEVFCRRNARGHTRVHRYWTDIRKEEEGGSVQHQEVP